MQFRVSQPDDSVLESLARVGEVMMPKTFTAHVSDAGDGHPNVELTWEVRDGVPECREVRIRSTDDGHEVRCSGLAGIRIEDVLEEAVKHLLGVAVRGPGEHVFRGLTRVQFDPDDPYNPRLGKDPESSRAVIREVRSARAARKVKITDDLLQEVAAIYRANVERGPTAAVAEHFDKAHRTAALYVKRAREAGHLGAATKGKAGER